MEPLGIVQLFRVPSRLRRCRSSWGLCPSPFSVARSETLSINTVFSTELLAVHFSTRHFRFFLEGCSFTVYVDHKPLTLRHGEGP